MYTKFYTKSYFTVIFKEKILLPTDKKQVSVTFVKKFVHNTLLCSK